MLLRRITDSIYYLPFEQRLDRPSLYYIKGSDYSVAIDAGTSKRHVEKFYEGIMELNFPLPETTIITHWHWDHTFGLNGIHGKSLGYSLTNDILKNVQTWKWNEEDMKHREETGEDIPFCNEHILLEYPDLNEIEVKLLDKTIDSITIIDLGDRVLELIPRATTHSDDSLFILDKKDKVLFVGDAAGEDFYYNNQMYDEKKLRDLISFLESLDYNIYCDGHTGLYTKNEILDHLRNILEEDKIVTH